jgi:GntR family transcriptional repressor for pyruvate dehydrogenase complex
VDKAVEGLEPLRSANVNALILERLASYIRRRQLSAGDRLPSESALAQALGVSRGALREAMRSLQGVGALEARVGSGWYLSSFTLGPAARGLSLTLEPDERTFRELDEIRTNLEWLYLEPAVQVLDADDLAALGRAVDEMEAQAAADQSYFPQDRDFHERLFAKVPNQLLARFLDLFWTLCGEIGTRLEPVGSEAHRTAARQHRVLLAAIAAGDLAGARQALLRHHEENPIQPPQHLDTSQPVSYTSSKEKPAS